MIRDLVTHIVTNLVDNSSAITITETEKPGKPTLEIRVAAGDVGKVIGREGRTFRALRTLVQLLDGPSPRDITVDNLDA
jgi:predicted RNA-binding protein YlqC (UPF0109 family)